MTCPAKQDDQFCRLTSNHARHVAGYGKNMIDWPNDEYIPPPPRTSLKRMAELANELRRSLTV